MIGKQLLHYEIEARLGAGGMGEVYQGHDTKLGRSVGIKILPEIFAQDRDRVARFEREARLLASLNHPNIAALYGLEHQNGQHFLVMELIEGETLAERIERGRLPADEAFQIARQIAEALEAAHEKGIIHRDLKPANVKITPEGKVKVLDFGLAKAMEGPPGKDTLSNSPTISMAATNAGIILGTAAYMAPEQAKGLSTDHRSDIFSFGCVLFEMLTGRQTFSGDSVAEVIASVLKVEADVAQLPVNLHPRIPELLRRCLAKDPRRRWQAIADVRVEIESLLAEPRGLETPAASTVRQPLWRRAIPFAITALLAGVLTSIAFWYTRPAPPASITRFSVVLPEGQQLTRTGRHNIALSPDGETLVYVADNQLYLRAMGEIAPRPIQGTDLDVDTPFFSPDGQWIAFYAVPEGKLKKIAVTGGASVTICDFPNPYGASWGPDDQIVLGKGGQGIARVSANGGKPETIVKMDPGEIAHGPQMLPDGEHILFTVSKVTGPQRWDEAQVVVQSLKSGERTILIEGGSDARYLPTGHIVYALGSNLLAIPFDAKSISRAGGPVPLVENVMRSAPSNTAATFFAFADNGTMAYFTGDQQSPPTTSVALVDRKGHRTPLPVPAALYSNPRVSPDGKQFVAEVVDASNNPNLWIYDLSGSVSPRRLTFGGDNTSPVWTPDSQRVLYASNRENGQAVYSQRADGTGTPERLTEPKQAVLGTCAVSRDGKQLLLFDSTSGDGDVMILPLEGGGKPEPVISTQMSSQRRADFSPDGHWIVYSSSETGRDEVYVQPFPTTGAKYQLTTNGGTSPMWSPDGSQIFYLEAIPNSSLGRLIALDVRTSSGFAFTNPTPLVDRIRMGGPRYYDTPDGKTFIAVFLASDDAPVQDPRPEIRVTLNWFSELRQRVRK